MTMDCNELKSHTKYLMRLIENSVAPSSRIRNYAEYKSILNKFPFMFSAMSDDEVTKLFINSSSGYAVREKLSEYFKNSRNAIELHQELINEQHKLDDELNKLKKQKNRFDVVQKYLNILKLDKIKDIPIKNEEDESGMKLSGGYYGADADKMIEVISKTQSKIESDRAEIESLHTSNPALKGTVDTDTFYNDNINEEWYNQVNKILKTIKKINESNDKKYCVGDGKLKIVLDTVEEIGEKSFIVALHYYNVRNRLYDHFNKMVMNGQTKVTNNYNKLVIKKRDKQLELEKKQSEVKIGISYIKDIEKSIEKKSEIIRDCPKCVEIHGKPKCDLIKKQIEDLEQKLISKQKLLDDENNEVEKLKADIGQLNDNIEEKFNEISEGDNLLKAYKKFDASNKEKFYRGEKDITQTNNELMELMNYIKNINDECLQLVDKNILFKGINLSSNKGLLGGGDIHIKRYRLSI